jgi:glycosyltransferase involved in cell wall biosynthesis
MASGLPPVCANEGGASGFIRDNITGLLSKPRDPEDMAKKIENLLDHPEYRENMAHEAFLYSQKQTWQRSFDTILASYAEITGDHDYFSPIKEIPAPFIFT